MKKKLETNKLLSLVLGAGFLLFTATSASAQPSPYSPAGSYNSSSYSNSRASAVPSYKLSRPEVNIKSFSNTPKDTKAADGYQPKASVDRIHNQNPGNSRFSEKNDAQGEDEEAAGFYEPIDTSYSGKTKKRQYEKDGILYLEGSD